MLISQHHNISDLSQSNMKVFSLFFIELKETMK